MDDFLLKTVLRPSGNWDVIQAKIRFDDQCRNGHQTFTVTGDIYSRHTCRKPCVTYDGQLYGESGGGCVHQEIKEAFPELAPFVKWHHTSTDEPLHYVANGVFWHELWQASLDPLHEKRADAYVYKYGTGTLRKHFLSTIVFDPEEADADELVKRTKSEITEWLENRLPRLMTSFREDLAKVFQLKETLECPRSY